MQQGAAARHAAQADQGLLAHPRRLVQHAAQQPAGREWGRAQGSLLLLCCSRLARWWQVSCLPTRACHPDHGAPAPAASSWNTLAAQPPAAAPSHSLVAQQRLAAGAAAVELLCRVKLAADDARDAARKHECRQRSLIVFFGAGQPSALKQAYKQMMTGGWATEPLPCPALHKAQPAQRTALHPTPLHGAPAAISRQEVLVHGGAEPLLNLRVRTVAVPAAAVRWHSGRGAERMHLVEQDHPLQQSCPRRRSLFAPGRRAAR